MSLDRLSTGVALNAFERGDFGALARLLREGGAKKTSVSLTAASNILNRNDHEGRWILLNRAAGCIAILPPATGSQDEYYIMVQTTQSGGAAVVRVANSSDSMVGNLLITQTTIASAFTGGTMEALGGGDDTITMNGTTQGGIAGTQVKCIDIAPNLWLVEGILISSGSIITGITNAV